MTTPYPDDPRRQSGTVDVRRVRDVVALAVLVLGVLLILAGAVRVSVTCFLFVLGVALVAGGLLIGYESDRE